MALIVENGVIVPNAEYDTLRRRRKFWRLSYDCYGPDYINGVDGEGVPMILKHKKEDDDDIKHRRERAVPLCLVGPIIRRYNDFIFRKEPIVDEEAFGDLWENIDGMGTHVNEVMSERLLDGQIAGVDYIFVDTNVKPSDEPKTEAQAATDGDQVVWRDVDADNVLQWRWHQGQLVEAAFLQQNKDGSHFVLWVDDDMWQMIPVTVDIQATTLIVKIVGKFEEIEPPTEHPYSFNPLIPLKPKFGKGLSQAASMSELQKSVARLRTLLDEEIEECTFTQTFVFGEAAENTNGNLETGAGYAVFLPNPDSRVENIGGDPAQADSIRQSVKDDRQELFRSAGIAEDAGEDGAVESGVAKAFKFNDLASILKSLSKASESAHRKAEKLTAEAMGIKDYQEVKYPDEFLMPIFEQELKDVIVANGSRLPRVIVDQLIIRFVKRNIKLDDKQEKVLTQQLEDADSSSDLGS